MLRVWKRFPLFLINSTRLARLSTTAAKAVVEGNNSSSYAVPDSPPVLEKDVKELQDFFDRSSKILVFTGAGISTESGIRDYRSKDKGLFKWIDYVSPKHSDFKSEIGNQRYWARDYSGWQIFMKYRPNIIHYLLADWERRGNVYWTVTQNVDALHRKAGARHMTELHGCMYWVKCINANCGEVSSRPELQTRLAKLNPDWIYLSCGYGPTDAAFPTDEEAKTFKIARCQKCGGLLRPDVVFEEGKVRKSIAEEARTVLSSCDSLLILGSSLQKAKHGNELISQAKKEGKPVGCVNIGCTAADGEFTFKIDRKCGDVLKKIVVNAK